MVLSLQSYFPFLLEADPPLLTELQKYAQSVTLAPGQILSSEGEEVNSFALVTRGVARVYKLGETGREITLYRVRSGESCILTAACALSGMPFPAIAEVEEELTAVVVPKPVFNRWVGQYEIWRRYVFQLFARRLAAIMATLEEVTFRRVDERIAELLLKHDQRGDHELHLTHQEIARELGTAREVVSRILKDFERLGFISLARGTIAIQNRKALRSRFKVTS